MDNLKQILLKVQDGEHCFKPDDNSKANLKNFQTTAKALIHAYNMGYLDNCKAIRETRTSNGWYTVVVLRSGLTYAGEQFLNAEQNVNSKLTESKSSSEDIVELKPNVFGIGVNLNAMWRWIMRKWD